MTALETVFRLLSVALGLTAALPPAAVCQSPSKSTVLPIVFDDWWNVDYVKNGCELSLRNSYAKPCRADTPEEIVAEFENEVDVAFALEGVCHGLELVHLTPEMIKTAVKNPAAPATGTMAKAATAQWTLMLDLDGHSYKQAGSEWSLVNPSNHIFSGRITTPKRLVQQVCKIAKGVGGTAD